MVEQYPFKVLVVGSSPTRPKQNKKNKHDYQTNSSLYSPPSHHCGLGASDLWSLQAHYGINQNNEDEYHPSLPLSKP
jgi:hypothetical protein